MRLQEAAVRKDEIEGKLKELQIEEDAVVIKMLDILENARKDIISGLAAEPSMWKYAYLSTMLQKVNERTNLLSSQLSYELDASVLQASAKGITMGTSLIPESSAFVNIHIDNQLLKTLAEYRADLIKGVSESVKDKVTEIVRRNMITGKSVLEVEKEIGSAVTKRGAFKTLAARLECITRNEYANVFELSNQASMNKAAEIVPGLKKKWMCIFRNSRDSHMAAHGQIVEYDKPFSVQGEKLMYPHDRAGSPGNVINCNCKSIPIVED